MHSEEIDESSYNAPVSSLLPSCHLQNDAYFAFCQMITECSLCAASKYCGWCGQSKQCLPGSPSSAVCPNDCLQNWIFDTLNVNLCSLKDVQPLFNSGRLDNLAPDSAKLVTALLTPPKFRVRSIEKTLKPVKMQYKVGMVQQKTQEYFTDNKGHFNSKGSFSNKPLNKNIIVNLPIDQSITEHFYDAETNALLNPQQDKVTHGQ